PLLLATEGVRVVRLREGLTLDEPCLHAVLTHADDANLRRTLWRAARQRATSPERDNRPLIARILALRAEKAALLGYANFGALVLEERMAHDPERARAFLAELEAHSRPAFEAECAALEGFMRQHTGLAEATLAPWDVAYFAEKQRKATLGFDEEALKAYFPLEQVLEGLFALCQQLFRIQITAVDLPTYHKSVRSYRISDEGGQALAHFYADFFPRPGKRGGAWMDAFGYASAGLTDRSQHHIGVICANLSPPTDDLPALLTMREVETVFHEFGHLLHHALTDVPVRSLAGTNVAWDFVELPSQIMENWCWEKEGLDRIARHWQSGESLPDALWQRMQQARRYRAASAMMRQIGFATTDLALHLDYQPEVHNGPTDYARSVLARYAPAALPDDDAMIAGFSHLFGGAVAYACGYYSYKWAEVLDADAFSRFKEEGIFSPEVGRDWRTQVLAQGNSQKPEALFASFRGRPPRIDALLQRAGIAPNMVPAAGAC
ncbi:MAG: M3 family metallopeptidase, partial [Polyangiales bacterium]